MSTFAVFGMTRALAVAEARKKTPATRADKSRGGVEPIPLDEWLGMVEVVADRIMAGTQVRQISPMFDATSMPSSSLLWPAQLVSAATCASAPRPN